MKKIVILAVVLSIAFISNVQAQSLTYESENIKSFHSEIAVSKDSKVNVKETIVYDFTNLQRRGIERFVPVKIKSSEGSGSYYYKFKFIKATQDKQKVKMKQRREGDYVVMRLGDPNLYITGVHSYVIEYEISPSMLKSSEGDYFNWNITGNGWNVPIKTVSANIRFLAGKSINQSRCYSGAVGATEENCSIKTDGNELLLQSGRELAAYEGITINALLPVGTHNIYQQSRLFPPINWPLAFGFIVGSIAFAIGLIRMAVDKLKERAKQKSQTIVPQYEPPAQLSPGEVGMLTDSKSSNVEITATIIDLAIKGYIKIKQIQAKTLFKKPDFEIQKIKNSTSLSAHEKDVYELITNNSKSSLKLSDLSPTTSSVKITSFMKNLKSNLEDKGYYINTKSKVSKMPKSSLTVWFAISVTVSTIIGMIIFMEFAPSNWKVFFFSIGTLLVGVSFARYANRTVRLTSSGIEEWADVEGLKLYLEVAEKQRLEFHDAPDKTPEHFSKLLPYAIALGVEKQWANHFKDIDISQSQNWYSSNSTGSHALSSVYIANSLSTDFSSTLTSSVAPASSGGSYSGGGFSGGGGGGGGGGSW